VAAGRDLPGSSAVAGSRADGQVALACRPGPAPSTLDLSRAVKSGSGRVRPCACGLRRDRASRTRCRHFISPKAPFQPGVPALVPREPGRPAGTITPALRMNRSLASRGPVVARPAPRLAVGVTAPHLQKSGKWPSYSRAEPQSLPGSRRSPAAMSASDWSLTCGNRLAAGLSGAGHVVDGNRLTYLNPGNEAGLGTHRTYDY
jgi:hypothetical protein